MKLSFEQAENLLKKKMRKNQLIFIVAIVSAIGVFFYSRETLYLFMSFYFIALGALNLPAINKCKSDMHSVKQNQLEEVTGRVLDIFPQKEDNKDSQTWYMFIATNEDDKYIEFLLPQKPDELIAIDRTVKIRFTKSTQLPIEIEIA